MAGPDGSHPVRLVDVPAALHLRHIAHLDDLLHEMAILRAGAESGTVELTAELAKLVRDVSAYAGSKDSTLDQARAALDRGEPTVTIELQVPAAAADASIRLVTLLERADEVCRREQLLTLAAPPEVVAHRRWLAEEVVRQVRDQRPPRPYGA
jgi:DNA-binding response OmpR family regulator